VHSPSTANGGHCAVIRRIPADHLAEAQARIKATFS
jgi:hypothetical protein